MNVYEIIRLWWDVDETWSTAWFQPTPEDVSAILDWRAPSVQPVSNKPGSPDG